MDNEKPSSSAAEVVRVHKFLPNQRKQWTGWVKPPILVRNADRNSTLFPTFDVRAYVLGFPVGRLWGIEQRQQFNIHILLAQTRLRSDRREWRRRWVSSLVRERKEKHVIQAGLETAIKKLQASIELSLAAGAAGNEHLGKDAGELCGERSELEVIEKGKHTHKPKSRSQPRKDKGCCRIVVDEMWASQVFKACCRGIEALSLTSVNLCEGLLNGFSQTAHNGAASTSEFGQVSKAEYKSMDTIGTHPARDFYSHFAKEHVLEHIYFRDCSVLQYCSPATRPNLNEKIRSSSNPACIARTYKTIGLTQNHMHVSVALGAAGPRYPAK
ncbi:hypothetical protein BD769DRAFT_1391192 [Suillus cothurnatus]|nr:hypothetical protein BD769DRAFT_1391192 [Suillus cothurnatus]